MFDEARDAYVLALAANSGAADATWRKGNEAFISYGALSNARLLLLYGFCAFGFNHSGSTHPAARHASCNDQHVALLKFGNP